MRIWASICVRNMSLDIHTVEWIGSPLGEDAGQHERVVKVRVLLGLGRQMIASHSLITKVAE